MIQQRFFGSEGAMRIEGEIESNDGRDCNRAARHQTNKFLVAHTAAHKPVDSRTRKRRKDDQAEKVSFHQKNGLWLLVLGLGSPFLPRPKTKGPRPDHRKITT